MNKSETIWEDENKSIKIIIEVDSKTECDCTTAYDILKQAEYCIKGLGYDDDALHVEGEKDE